MDRRYSPPLPRRSLRAARERSRTIGAWIRPILSNAEVRRFDKSRQPLVKGLEREPERFSRGRMEALASDAWVNSDPQRAGDR